MLFIQVFEDILVIELVVEDGCVFGVWLECVSVLFEFVFIVVFKVLLVGGGLGGFYVYIMNLKCIWGQVIGMVVCVGVVIFDLEFVQFYFIVFDIGEDFVFLVIEVLWGEGVILINCYGEWFMLVVYFDVEFVLCDIVVWVIFVEIEVGNCFMFDICQVLGVEVLMVFLLVVEICVCVGIDLVVELIFVIVVVYYYMGGINVDQNGCISIENFWVCGEVLLIGLYGVN